MRSAASLLQALREKVRAGAENLPGTYRMCSASGVVLYVGKSKRLRTRLLGYFRAKRETKAWRIMREAHTVEWDYEPSEFASLLRELQLIKRHRPPHNVRQRRDGVYSFLKVSPGPAPRLMVARRVVDDGATYLGPLRGGARFVAAIRVLNDVLGLRDCALGTPIRFADQQDLFGEESTPLCARHELRRCSAPCAGLCAEREYQGRVEIARAFLDGGEDEPIRRLEQRMQDAIERLQYEYAASLRERIARLEMLRFELMQVRDTLGRLTFLYVVPGVGGDDRVYAVRSGSIRAVHPLPRTPADREALRPMLAQHYRLPESPAELATRQRADQAILLAHWFRTRETELGRTLPPTEAGNLPLLGEIEASPALA